MKILCAFGRHNYGDSRRGDGYEYSNFIPALLRLGHHVCHFDTLGRDTYVNFAELNRAFLDAVEREKPDLVLCALMHYEIWTETLDLVRRTCPTVLINWATDDSWKYERFSRYMAPHLDLYASTDEGACLKARRAGLDNFFLTQWAANGDSLLEPMRANECRFAVSFVGSVYGNRPKIIAALKKRGIEVECFGYGWPNGPVSAEQIPRIMRQSIISLNFAEAGIRPLGFSTAAPQIKARLFEVPGAGGFLLTQAAQGLERYFVRGKEIDVFDDVDELAKKIRFYLDHPTVRDEIAKAGHARVHAEHTYDIRFRHLLNEAERRRRTTSAAPTWKFGEREIKQLMVKSESRLPTRPFRRLLAWPFVLFWGAQRGPRAARRFLFELSWRLLGAKTYSVAGLPGKLFYRES